MVCLPKQEDTMALSNSQRRKIIEGIAEANRLIEKEMRYSPEFHKMDYIVQNERFIAKLVGYLENDAMPSIWIK
jgi:hypothetical protein